MFFRSPYRFSWVPFYVFAALEDKTLEDSLRRPGKRLSKSQGEEGSAQNHVKSVL